MKVVTILSELEDNDELGEAWVKVFKLGISQIEMEYISENLIPVLFSMQSLKANLKHRVMSADMLLEIVIVYGEKGFDYEAKLLNVIFVTGEDINWKIRKLAANRLRYIIPRLKSMKNLDPEKYNFGESLERLMTDEENFVKIEAFITITHGIPYLKANEIEENLLPILKETLSKDTTENDEFVLPIASIIGNLLFSLNKIGLMDKIKREGLKLFKMLLTSDDEEYRKKAAYNLPFFFTQFYDTDSDPESVSIFDQEENSKSEEDSDVEVENSYYYVKQLALDECLEVRQIIASGYHELLMKIKSTGRPLGPYKDLFYTLLTDRDELIMIGMVQNLDKFLEVFRNEIVTSADNENSDTDGTEESKEIPVLEPRPFAKVKINAKDSK